MGRLGLFSQSWSTFGCTGFRREILHGLMDRQGFVLIEAESYAAVTQDLGGFILDGLDVDLIPVYDKQEATDAIHGLMPQLNKA